MTRPMGTPMSTSEQDEDYVEVRGTGWSSPRGLGDIRMRRMFIDQEEAGEDRRRRGGVGPDLEV